MYPVEVAIAKDNEYLYQLTKHTEEEFFFLFETVMLDRWNISCPRHAKAILFPNRRHISREKT